MYQLCNKAPRPVTCRGPELSLQFDTLAVLYPKRPVLTQDSDPKSKAWSCALNFLSQLKNRSFWLFQWGNRCRNTGQDNEAVLSLYETQNSWSLPSFWLPRIECGAMVSAPAICFCQRRARQLVGRQNMLLHDPQTLPVLHSISGRKTERPASFCPTSHVLQGCNSSQYHFF